MLLLAMSLVLWFTPPTNAFVPSNTFGYRRSTASLAFFNAPLQSQVQTEHDATTNLDPLAVREYTEEALQFRGEPRGLAALEKLGKHCAMRTPYDFNTQKQDSKSSDTVLAPQKGLIPSAVTDEFLDQVRLMEQNGWLSTNPDSVDGLPSLHLNLVSGGKPIAQRDEDDFQIGLQKLLSTVKPYIYDELLPTVQELTNDASTRVSDVFLRRYGEDIGGEEGNSRNGISAHYDVFSKVTSVIAMDDTAAEGTNGLYTTEMSQNGSTSNHASLRRFFPLEKGDAVVHSWDVLHGVDVEPDSDRMSLIVWFTTEEVLNSPTPMTSPWLVNNPDIEDEDVAQFVLASALVSTETDVSESSPEDAAMHHQESLDIDAPTPESFSRHPHDLYLKSAASGNTFALTKLGSLAQDQELSHERAKLGLAILEKLRPNGDVPFVDEKIAKNDGSISFDALAKQFWYEGAVRGNPMAQAYLADDVMEQAATTGKQDLRLLAAALFGLAAQQGNEVASESLSRVVEFEVAQSGIQSQEEFEASPVVKTANAALQ